MIESIRERAKTNKKHWLETYFTPKTTSGIKLQCTELEAERLYHDIEYNKMLSDAARLRWSKHVKKQK